MVAAHGKNWVEISRSAVMRNVASIKGLVGEDVRLMAVVKSNAYGHGLGAVAKILKTDRNVSWFGVDSFEEATAVRDCGTRKPILILGHVPHRQLKKTIESGFSVAAYDVQQIIEMNAAANASRPAKIHLKLETGTSRQGVLPEDLLRVIKAIKKCANTTVEGVYTHFADVEDTDDSSYAMRQLACYHDGLEVLRTHGIVPKIRHAAASGAAMLHPSARLDLVRVGIALYGQWPSENISRSVGNTLRLYPAMTVKASVAQIKKLPVGTPIGYGLTEVLKRNTRIAVITAGYNDGYDRGLSSIGHILVRGKRAKVLGRICMNMTVVDVTDIPGVNPGDEAVLLGRQRSEEISADEIGSQISTINYEVVTRVNPLLPRVIVD